LEIFQSILFGIIQGLTEFLPVSSSAHLSAIPQLMGIKSELLNSLAFDVVLHGGTLLSVLFFFRKKVLELIKGFFKGLFSASARKTGDFRLSIYIVIATIPAVLAALFFQDAIEGIFRNPVYTGTALIVFGIILWLADIAGKKQKSMSELSVWDSIIIGAAQALSVVPGVSRSGITITAGLFAGVKREDAAEFAFLISIPAIAGALVFKLKDIMAAGASGSAAVLAAGFLSSALAGFAAIAFLLYYIKKNSFRPFVIYRIMLGAYIIAAALKVF
jgi:undecaprenyl-diphosphatase